MVKRNARGSRDRCGPQAASRSTEGVKKKKAESADKPGSVVDNHSSGRRVTAFLKQPTRIQCEQHRWIPIWPCSRWGLPCHGMLPPMRCALTAPFHPYPTVNGLAVSFCCTFRRLAPPRRYLAPCSVEPGLSSAVQAPPRLSGRLRRASLETYRAKTNHCFCCSFNPSSYS